LLVRVLGVGVVRGLVLVGGVWVWVGLAWGLVLVPARWTGLVLPWVVVGGVRGHVCGVCGEKF
jgi:hypothetical protein